MISTFLLNGPAFDGGRKGALCRKGSHPVLNVRQLDGKIGTETILPRHKTHPVLSGSSVCKVAMVDIVSFRSVRDKLPSGILQG